MPMEARRGQNFPELGLQEVVWVLGTELRVFAGAVCARNHWAVSPNPFFFKKVILCMLVYFCVFMFVDAVCVCKCV